MAMKLQSAKYILCILLSGCATQTVSTFQPYAPLEEMKSSVSYNNDLQECRYEAQDYLSGKSTLDPSEIASEGLQKGLSGLGTGIASPYAPALYGLGGASSEGVSELGLNSQDVKTIIAWCMHDHGQSSGQYHVYDPNL